MSLAYPPHGPKDRFKVVKIVSSLPLRRGRWNVVDYPDKEKTSKETSSGIPTSGISSSVPPQASVVPPSVGYANVDTSETGSMVRWLSFSNFRSILRGISGLWDILWIGLTSCVLTFFFQCLLLQHWNFRFRFKTGLCRFDSKYIQEFIFYV